MPSIGHHAARAGHRLAGSAALGQRLWKLVAISCFVLVLITVGIAAPSLRVGEDLGSSHKGWIWESCCSTPGLASVLPVWTLLQPRDFLNSLLLYLGLG